MRAAEAFVRTAAESDRMFWLDGGGARPWSGRRSVIGALAPEDVSLTFDATRRRVLRHQHGRAEPVGDDIFAALEEHIAADGGDPTVSWVGYLGYAARTDLPGRPADPASGVPDAVWMRVRDPWLFEHRDPDGQPDVLSERANSTLSGRQDAPARATGDVRTRQVGARREGYAEAFVRVQEELRHGNSYEVNLTYREHALSGRDPVATYLRLRELNPAPYSGYLQHQGVHLLSSSPERYATVDRHRRLEARPIKGTTPRAQDPATDDAERDRLASDPKFRAENLMIVDLLRNDVGMVCEPGTVTVPELMQVESYRSVHQLVSTIRGNLRPEVGTVEALRALFPAGSMTGAPKLRTMRIIDAVEDTPRGVYAGAFGWVGADGRADLAVVIRSLVATRSGDRWRYEWGTGGGITVRSDVDEEYAETLWKAARLRSAVEG